MGCCQCSQHDTELLVNQNINSATKLENDKVSDKQIFTPQKDNKQIDFQIEKGMVRSNSENILEFYKLGEVLGEGGFGTVCLAMHKQTGIQRALKMIQKNKLDKHEETKLFEELSILKQLDHPNILKIFEHFEDNNYHYLVSEICAGGELFDRIQQISPFTEQLAAQYMKQILSAISYCHYHKIVHRDLKPENILFDTKQNNSNLKIIDFGASAILKNNQKLTQAIGTPYYVAPEILKEQPYDEKCDVWSIGVILYIMLCGYPPFNAESDDEIYNLIKSGKFEFHSRDWKYISSQVKDLIQKMLTLDPVKRISAAEAYAHPWVVNNIHVEQLDDKMMNKLTKFTAKNKLRVAILQLMVNQVINTQDKKDMVKHFQALDTNGDGMLSKKELVEGYTQITKDPLKAQTIVDQVFAELDQDGNGKIEYTEFLVISLQKEKLYSKEKIEKAFKLIDQDGNGSITKNELEAVMGGIPIKQQAWNELLNDCDVNNDGKIQLNEFANLLVNIANKDIAM